MSIKEMVAEIKEKRFEELMFQFFGQRKSTNFKKVNMPVARHSKWKKVKAFDEHRIIGVNNND